jgi:hypothetical protein
MILNHFRTKGSWEPTDESKAALKDADIRLQRAAHNKYGQVLIHEFAYRNMRDLIGLAQYSGGAYISNDGIDEFCNDIEAVIDLDFAEELYACYCDDEDIKDPESVGYREFCTNVDVAQATLKNLRPLDIDVLKLCADIRPLYFDDLFGGDNISGETYDLDDESDSIDVIVAIANKIVARLEAA